MERKKKPTNWSQTPEGKARQSRIRQRNLAEAERSISDDRRRNRENITQTLVDTGMGISTIAGVPGMVRGAAALGGAAAKRLAGAAGRRQVASKAVANETTKQAAKQTATKASQKVVKPVRSRPPKETKIELTRLPKAKPTSEAARNSVRKPTQKPVMNRQTSTNLESPVQELPVQYKPLPKPRLGKKPTTPLEPPPNLF